ncbi:atp dependent lon protease family member [Holotrichia oblita]|nr:atp dependent lon protease family member [Holotrichia oblita]
MIALRGLVVFPGQTISFDLGRDKSLLALNRAVEENQEVFLVAQKHSGSTNPAPKDIYRVGTLSKVKQIIKLPNDCVRVLVTGVERKIIDAYKSIVPFFEVTLKDFVEKPSDDIMLEAVKRKVTEQYEQYKKLNASKIPLDIEQNVSLNNTKSFIGVIATYVVKNDAKKQEILELDDEFSQLDIIYEILANECEIIAIEKKITSKVRKNIDKNQREYYLREQIKVIHDELGESEDEVAAFNRRAKEKKLPQYVMDKFNKEVARMEKMSPTVPEAGVIRTYLEWILDLPWNELAKENQDLKKAREILDHDHYGLDKVKERIIEYLAVHQLTKALKGPILCFVGPPGVGKTSIVESIARASGRKLVSMSLGGVRDEAEIRGHRRTYIGAMPGRLISGMKQAEVVNPVFLLDEIDKMSSDFRGDPASAMLEVLDPNQNNSFKDHYLELGYDLSKVMFVTTANSLDPIPAPLLDRMEVIELSGYTYEEKLQIAKRYLLPKQLKANGLEEKLVNVPDDVLMEIISKYTRESGVRNLEREIATVSRKIAVKVVNSDDKSIVYNVKKEDLTEYLGIAKYRESTMNQSDEIGLATGLAWTSVGGVTLDIEVVTIPDGKGEVVVTGSLGDVMKESCKAAMSVVKSRARQFNIDPEIFTKHDIHIHLPEGATPKDGPSAGITMATALLSALSKRKVDKNVAMTGEITLRGKVLPIGGLKEKSLAAFRSGIKKLIIPLDNKKDVADIPKEVQSKVTDFKIKKAEFVTSIAAISVYKNKSEEYRCDEICVAGRSNVGKSSFINMIANRKIAKTSSTPGRTRLLNLFSFNDDAFMLVDLPGYGYAKASKADKDKWGGLIEEYFSESKKLKHVFALVDIRHEPSVLDKQMIMYLYDTGISFTVIATKCDKLSKAQQSRNIQMIATSLKIGKDNIIPISVIGRLNLSKVEERIGQIIEKEVIEEVT